MAQSKDAKENRALGGAAKEMTAKYGRKAYLMQDRAHAAYAKKRCRKGRSKARR